MMARRMAGQFTRIAEPVVALIPESVEPTKVETGRAFSSRIDYVYVIVILSSMAPYPLMTIASPGAAENGALVSRLEHFQQTLEAFALAKMPQNKSLEAVR
jgi:hypothetical protein